MYTLIHDFIIFLFRLLVGAPTADSGQPDVIKGGAVFKCPPDNPGQCDLIPFDTKGMKVGTALHCTVDKPTCVKVLKF